MVYTRHDSPKEFVVRGIKLLMLGLVINTMYFLFKDKNLRIGSAIILLSYIVMGGGLFVVSLFLQTVLNLNAFNTGLTTLLLTVGLLIFAVAAPSLTGKLNHKTLMAIGSIMSIIGCLILSFQFKMNITMFDLMPGMFIL